MSEDLLNLNQTADDAEMVLLGGLMLETERFDTVVLKINHHDFKNERHQLIFESMGELVNENKPLDPITLSEDLDNKNKLVKLIRKPKFSEVPYPVIMEPNLVIEYYSR